MNKMDVLEQVINTGASAKIKTDRRYIRLDAKTAQLILGYAQYMEPRIQRSYLGMGWQPIITAAHTHATHQAKVRAVLEKVKQPI